MACPLLDDVVDEEVLILRRAFRHERVIRDRAVPLESLASLYRPVVLCCGEVLGWRVHPRTRYM